MQTIAEQRMQAHDKRRADREAWAQKRKDDKAEKERRRATVRAVYEIRCNATGEVYIGQSVEPKDRFSHHKSDLRRGTHHAKALQAAWDEYGNDNFSFRVLEDEIPIVCIDSREQHWIDQNADKLLNGSMRAAAGAAGPAAKFIGITNEELLAEVARRRLLIS